MLRLKELKFRTFTSLFASYLGTSIVNKLLPFLLLPFLTKFLSPSEYGILSLYQVFISFSETIVGFRSKGNISRNYFKGNSSQLGEVIFNMLIVLSFVFGIALLGISFLVLIWKPNIPFPTRWIVALPLIGLMNTLNGYYLVILRNGRKPLLYGGMEISRTMLNLFVSIVAVGVFALGWEGRAFGILMSSIVFGLISLNKLWSGGFIELKFSLKKVLEIVHISVPLVIHGIGVLVINLSDRFFISSYVGVNELGIYTVGYQFGMIVLVSCTAFVQAWSPFFYESMSKQSGDYRVKIVSRIYLAMISFVILSLCVTLLSRYAIPVFTAREYHNAHIYVFWIALGYAFNGMYSLIQPFGIHVGKTGFQAVTTGITALVNLLLNYLLVPEYGALGAAKATLISYFVMFLLVWWHSRRLISMPWFSSLRGRQGE